MPAITTKLCVLCGIDVSTQKRVRDPAGSYFCRPCYDSRVTRTAKRDNASEANRKAERHQSQILDVGVSESSESAPAPIATRRDSTPSAVAAPTRPPIKRSAKIAVAVVILLVGCFISSGVYHLTADNDAKRLDVSTDAVSALMESWRSSGSSAVEMLDPRAIDPVRKCVRELQLKSFDGKITNIGERTITVFETGEQHPCQTFEVTPVLRMSDTLFLPTTFKISVAIDSGKVLLVVPERM